MSFWECDEDIYLLAWTTTPDIAFKYGFAVNKKVNYVLVRTVNQYTKKPIVVVLAEKLLIQFFPVNMFL